MGSQNSKNQNDSSTENREEEADKNDNVVAGAVVAGAAVAAGVLAVWGLSKLIESSEPEENNMLMGSTVSVKHQGIDNILMGSTGSSKLEEGGYDDDDDKWTKPKYGWFKLNTDASVLPKQGYKASAGGLIRDHTGEWIVGFTARLKPCDIRSAELQAVRDGMKLACDRGLKKVIIESDSEQAVNLIKNPKWNSENHPLGCIIEECRNLMKMKHSDWELFHICREKNKCADAMANKAKNQINPLKIWEETPPGRVHDLVSADMYDYVVY